MAKTTLEKDSTLPKMLTQKEVAEHLGISLSMASKLMNKDGFPTVRIGKRVLVREDRYKEWLEKLEGTKIWF